MPPATGANDPLFDSVRCARELHDRVVLLSGNIVALLIFVDCESQIELGFLFESILLQIC